MKIGWLITLVLLFSAAGAVPAMAHEVPNIEHTHAFQKTDYGVYRQGHYVNGPQGSIIIWSPRAYTGYRNQNQVKFARPTPITRAPGSPIRESRTQRDPAITYGKK
jgi:hypothetical protein